MFEMLPTILDRFMEFDGICLRSRFCSRYQQSLRSTLLSESRSLVKIDSLVNLTIPAVSLRSTLSMFCLHQCRYINTGSFVVYVLVLVLVLWRWNRRASATPVATRFWFLFDIAFKMCSKAILDSPSKVAIAGFGATWVWFGFLFWWFGIITNQRFVMGF